VGIPVNTIMRARRLVPAAAVAFGVLVVALGLAGVPLGILAHHPVIAKNPVAGRPTAAVVVLPGALVGALLAARRPHNPIGWILLTILLLTATPSGDYAVLDYRMHHGTLPLGWVAVVLLASWPMWLVLIAILLWVFPDGQLPAGRWRKPAVVLAAAGVLGGLVTMASGLVAVAGHDVHIDPSGSLTTSQTGIWAIVPAVLNLGFLASMLAWLIRQVPRYRRSAGERRQQLKWLYSGAIVLVVCLVATAPFPARSVVNNLSAVGLAAFPVCIGIAVLKYRLYEIDRIISRVISYTLVTAVLAGVFAGIILLATAVLPVKTPVAVAAATLAAAALFNPLRRRMQGTVDRRFNRARYNAEAVVAAFTARLRHTVDLDTARADLVAAVDDAFQPTHVSVWLTATSAVDPSPARPAASRTT
jgi:hypothetical protein